VPDDLHDLIQRAYRTRRTRARQIIDACLERLSHYRGLPDSLLAEVHESVLHHLGLLYRVTLETGHPLSAEDLEASRELARRRAAQGVPLGEFLTFFLVGLTMAWEHLMASAGDDPLLRGRLLDRVAAVISNQTQLMTALTESYVEERERQSRFREQDLNEWFQLLLAEQVVENVLETRGRALGIRFDEPHAAAVLDPASGASAGSASVGAPEVRRALAAELGQAEVWVGRCREGFVALLPRDATPAALAAAVAALGAEGARVGLGRAERGVAGLHRSAREALRALRIAALLGRPGCVHRYADLEVVDLLDVGSAHARDFARRVLGPLAAAGGSRTHLETLRQLARNGYTLKLAAAALDVHPHTLSYRVKQMRRRYGLDLDDADVRLRVQLALLILDAQVPAGPARRARGASPAAS
jgi:sugar diacid utilization regulator